MLARTLSPHLQAALEVKMGVYGKYGKKDEQGMIRVPDAKMEALTTELNALKSETVEVAVPLLTEEDFSAAQITPAQALSLLPLIETPTEAQSNESK